MSKDEIFEILKKALVELFEIDESKVVPEAKIYEDLQIDSIDAIDLVDYVKKNTGYKLMPDDFKKYPDPWRHRGCRSRKARSGRERGDYGRRELNFAVRRGKVARAAVCYFALRRHGVAGERIT